MPASKSCSTGSPGSLPLTLLGSRTQDRDRAEAGRPPARIFADGGVIHNLSSPCCAGPLRSAINNSETDISHPYLRRLAITPSPGRIINIWKRHRLIPVRT